MAIALPTQDSSETQAATVRRIEVADLWIALRQGYDDFLARRGDIFFVAVIYPFAGLVAALAALRANMVPYVFPLVAGLVLLGPLVAIIFYEVARRRERGEDAGWRAAFDHLRGPSFDALLTVAAVLIAVFAAWMIAAWAIYTATLGPEAPTSVTQFARDLFGTPEGWTMIVVGNLTGLVFAVLALAIGVVSFPMLVDRPVSPTTALATSFRAVARNPGTMLVWGLVVVTLLVLGSLPFLIGLAVVLPVLGYSTWHLYTRVVER